MTTNHFSLTGSMSKILRLSLTAFSVFTLSSLAWADQPPNIVLMMADDMGLGDTSAYQDFTGNADAVQIATPNMQRLARMGVLFTDAHTPSSRCTTTRYGLLTGRYAWRNRLKHYVLFGVQGDPLLEADRPTLGTLLQAHGYRTGLFGKWHVGLRYRQSDGRPAAGWDDADLSQPMADTPLDHGFDVCRFTSRSHATSGLAGGARKGANGIDQSSGPGHIDGRTIISAVGRGKQLQATGAKAYVLKELGGRHSDNAVEFLESHLSGGAHADQPFFLYYPSNSNHSPYTPDQEVGGVPVAGHSRSVSGQKLDARSDFIYENDVALGRLIDFLQTHDDPRRPGRRLIENTIVIFTSDNGAEIAVPTATGPCRSNKGSCYEGGHRVPFIVAWPAGNVGDGDATTQGQTNTSLIGLHDMFATFTEILGDELPDLRTGQKGAEDSRSVLAAWRGGSLEPYPMFYHDHKEAQQDPAACALRLDHPRVNGQIVSGQWKIIFDASLLRTGESQPLELFDLATDPQETNNRLQERALQPLVTHLCDVARLHRNCGGHRYSSLASTDVLQINFQSDASIRKQCLDAKASQVSMRVGSIQIDIAGEVSDTSDASFGFHLTDAGLGLTGGVSDAVDSGQALLIRCDRDVLIDSVALVAGGQPCGGFYQVGKGAPLQLYCVDADIDSKNQSGVLSDIGLLKAGETLRLSTAAYLGVETPGSWRVGSIQLRELSTAGGAP
jgi:arylsulfatase A